MERSQLDILKENPQILDGIDYLISPDKGASLKTKAIGKLYDIPVIYCNKARDSSNGFIVYDEVNCIEIRDKSVLIVDDLCDGGMTFILLAKMLRKSSPKSLSLYVTHGIFSKGKSVLTDAGINTIHCINDFTKYM